MIRFERSEELTLIRKTADDFGRERIRPQNRKAEANQSIAPELKQQYTELGFDLIDLPEAWDGLGLGLIGRTEVETALAYADAGISLGLGSIGVAHQFLSALASEAQHETWIKQFLAEQAVVSIAWSDLKPKTGGFSATAEAQADGSWRLNARKAYVLNGAAANYFLVFAQAKSTDGAEQTSVFLVDAQSDGLKKGTAQSSLGLEAAPFIELTLEHVHVPGSQMLANAHDEQAIFRALVRASVLGAARQTGIATAAFDLACEHAENRTAFGKPIAHFQGLAFLIADMATTVEVMRIAVARAAYALDHSQEDALSLGVMAIAECHEGAMFVTNNAVQILGGTGFIRDYPAEKWMRDAKAHMAYGIPRQLCDLIAGRLALQDVPLSLAEDSPLPELQAVML